VSDLAVGVLAGDRRALARAITLVESTRADDETQAFALLNDVLPRAGGSVRVGISGPPGAGKSTFIEALGLHLVEHGHRVAVLAVDPSSVRTGGAILGDKTRMAELTSRPEAFVRPSPTSGTLGGVTRHTREAIVLCEAAGFDVVVVETVGVGQSEVAVHEMVDCFVVLITPGGGDELQGIKRGIMELADVVVVNKADGDLAAAAGTTASEYASAFHLVRPRTPGWTPRVVLCSALQRTGIDDVWRAVEEHHATLEASGELGRRRASQSAAWMWEEITDRLEAHLRSDPGARAAIEHLGAQVRDGTLLPRQAAAEVLDSVLRRSAHPAGS
jgi:GTPase